MLPGKLSRIIKDAGDINDIIRDINEGYLKVSWKEKDTLKTGCVLISNGIIVGALVEDILNGRTIKGEKALKEIEKIAKNRLVRIIEVYSANVDEILKEDPELKASKVATTKIPGWDLDTLIKLLTSHTGRLRVHDGSTSWELQLEQGNIKAARTIRGPLLKGDRALKELIKGMGHIIKSGEYEADIRGGNFYLEERTREGKLFRDVVDLFREKRRLEGEEE